MSRNHQIKDAHARNQNYPSPDYWQTHNQCLRFLFTRLRLLFRTGIKVHGRILSNAFIFVNCSWQWRCRTPDVKTDGNRRRKCATDVSSIVILHRPLHESNVTTIHLTPRRFFAGGFIAWTASNCVSHCPWDFLLRKVFIWEHDYGSQRWNYGQSVGMTSRNCFLDQRQPKAQSWNSMFRACTSVYDRFLCTTYMDLNSMT